MDLNVDEFIKGLLTQEALDAPSDTVKKEDESDLELPEWYDEKKFNRARKFYWENCFALTSSMLVGLLAVLAVPSILKVLVGTRRSSSLYTSYKRYLSTILHTSSWFEYDLKPGSKSWKSLLAVRSRHFRAGKAAKLQGNGVVSQRDLALTQFGFVGYSMVTPDKFGLRQLQPGDWEDYNHLWRVIGHMIGLEDRYNICRKTVDETREVCQLILDRVFTPCLENPPEYFEHMTRVMLEAMWAVNPTINVDAELYFVKHISNVPGYIYSEKDRVSLQNRIKDQLKGRPIDTGVDATSLIEKPAVNGLPARPPRLLYFNDYETIDNAPEYKSMDFGSRYALNFNSIIFMLHSTYLGRLYFKLNYLWSVILMKYCPYLAFFRFGIKASMVNIFEESPADDTTPKPNAEYYKPKPPQPWYKVIWSLFWFW